MKDIVVSELKKAVGGGIPFDVTVPEIRKFGDYSTNAAFEVGKLEHKNPMEVAKAIQEKLVHGSAFFERAEVVAPGFINLWIKNPVLLECMRDVLKNPGNWGWSKEGKKETAVVEYFQLNVAKIPHIGHLSSAVIGDALKRALRASGYKAVSDTHVGDWGTQFGILLYGYKNLGSQEQEAIQKDPFSKLNDLYVQTNTQIESNPELRESAKLEFAKLERGDKENRKIWEWMVEISMKKLEESAQALHLLPFDEHRGESSYENDMPAIVETALKKKSAVRNPDGSVTIDLKKWNLDDAVLIKSDGASTYLLRDLATIIYRKKHWKFTKNLYVVDTRQSHHFRQVFKVAEMLGFEGVGESEHVGIGFMSLPEGPMSTRKGTAIPLGGVLESVVGRAREVIEEKNPDLKNKDSVAEMVGVGALKYFVLSHHRVSDIVFDIERALSFDGNTGPYIQYTYARLQSILRKLQASSVKVTSLSMDDDERALLASLLGFPDAVRAVLNVWAPNTLVNYLFDVAQKANAFYHSHPVTQEKDLSKKEFRATLISAVAITLKNGLDILGIEAPEEM